MTSPAKVWRLNADRTSLVSLQDGVADIAYAAPAGGQTIAVSLTADGTDQSSSLQSQIDAAPDGNVTEGQTILELPAGSYRIDGTIDIRDRYMVTVRGPVGNMETAGTRPYERGYVPDDTVCFVGWTNLDSTDLGLGSRRHMVIASSTDCHWRYINFVGPNDERDPDPERSEYALWVTAMYDDHGFSIYAPSDGCSFTDSFISQVYGDGVYIGGGGTSGVTNANCEVSRIGGSYAGRQCIAPVNFDGFYSADTLFEWGARSGWDFEPMTKSDRCHNAVVVRAATSSLYGGIAMNGGYNDEPENVNPRYMNIDISDYTQINTRSTRGVFHDGKGTAGGYLRLTRLQGATEAAAVYWKDTGMSVKNGPTAFDTIEVKDCDINTAGGTGSRYFNLGGTGQVTTLTIENNACGAVEVLLDVNVAPHVDDTPMPTTYNHCGNVWDAGSQNDGTCP